MGPAGGDLGAPGGILLAPSPVLTMLSRGSPTPRLGMGRWQTLQRTLAVGNCGRVRWGNGALAGRGRKYHNIFERTLCGVDTHVQLEIILNN